MSVLFADLVGFTALSAERDPEAVRELLGRYFELASDIVGRYGGVVEKFIGDAVMAMWGAPAAHEDDAARAVRAALDLVGAVRQLGAHEALDLQARAAVLTGEAAVTLGAQGQGMVAGDLVNTASRLQSVAPPGSVLVGEATRLAAAGSVAFEAVGEQALRGKPVPVPAFRALRVVGDRRGAGRVELLEPPFVGRDDELRLLRELFHATGRERRARLVSVIGQAGIGKTRLAWELEKYLDGVVETVYWHAGRSPAYGEGITFWALGEMVRRRAGLAEGDDERTTRAAVAQMVGDWVPDGDERRWIETRLLPLLGIGEVPPGGREELFAAWRTFFERIAERGTTALVFEDLQWADPGLLDFIEHLLEWSRSLPIFVLTLSRPDLLERRPSWGTGQRSVSIRLEPLAERAMRELLAGLVPGLPEQAARAILDRADGIPLYAVETVRMLVADGRLTQARDAYQPTGDLTSLDVPASLHGLIAARLDALDPADRALVQDAAVLGQRFTIAALAAVAGRSPSEIEPRVRSLVRLELLVQETDPRSPERGQYGFVQALVREVAYATLSKRDRRSRHLAAARYFEGLGDEELAAALATQYVSAYRAAPEGPEGGAVAAQARVALRAAATRAAVLGSFAQAIGFVKQATEVTPDQSDRADLLDQAAVYGSNAGLFAEAAELAGQSLEIRRALADERGIVRATARLAVTLLAGSRVPEAVEVLEPVTGIALALGDDEATGLFAEAMARACFRSERMDEAVEWADRAARICETHLLDDPLTHALITKASALISLGRRREGLALLDGVGRQAEARGRHVQALRAGVNLAAMTSDVDPRASLAGTREGIELARRLGLRGFDTYQYGNASGASERTGEWEWFLASVHEAEETAGDAGSRLWLRVTAAIVLAWRGERSEDVLAELRAPGATWEADPQILINVAAQEARLAFVEQRFTAGYQAGMTGAGHGFESFVEITLAGRCALHARDVAGARASLDELGRGPREGAALADRHMLRAGIAALEGRAVDSLADYRQALDRYRDLGLRFDVALTGLDMAVLLGLTDPDVRRAAEESRAILAELRAIPLVDRLDRVLASEPASPSETVGSRVTAERLS